MFDRSVDGGDGNNDVYGFLFCAGDYVPWHSYAVLGFEIDEFRRHIAERRRMRVRMGGVM